MKTKNMTTLHLKTSISRSLSRSSLFSIAIALTWFALVPMARAVDPPPDGGYPNANTAEGDDALFSVTEGSENTAIGWIALFNNTTGSFKVATGSQALFSNTTGENNNTTGSNNIGLGISAGGNLTNGSNNIDIGNAGAAGESSRIRIGTSGTQTKPLLRVSMEQQLQARPLR
jgi:hypothetical protein